MCTLSIISVSGLASWPRGPIGLRIVASRDEERDRPAALPPRWRPLDQSRGRQAPTRAIWPTDPRGGGTWIAAAESGLVLCLLNVNLEPQPRLPQGLLSRGLIIPKLIASTGATAAVAALERMDLDRFAPFRLVAVEAGSGDDPRILEARWDRNELTLAPSTSAPACLVSSGLGDSKVQQRLAVFDEVVVQGGLTSEAQDRFHLHVWPDHPELSVLMSRPDARTVSITTVEVSAQSQGGAFDVRMGYQPVLEGGRLGLHEAAGARPVVMLGRDSRTNIPTRFLGGRIGPESACSQGLGQSPPLGWGIRGEVCIVMTDLVLRTARPASLPTLLSPVSLVHNLWNHRDLTKQFALRFFLARYRGTYLGAAWALVFPLILLGVYTFIFNFVFSGRASHQIPGPLGVPQQETSSEYAVWLFLGMTVFGIFSESVVRSCGLVLENPNYVTKVVFPLEIMPLASLASALMFSCFGFALVLIGLIAFYPVIHWTIVLLPLILLPLLALALGLSWFLASLAVFVRDISNLVVIVVGQLLFFMTPIFYRSEDLKDWAWLARINPLAVVVEGSRDVVLYGRMPDWASLGAVMALGLFVMQCGYAWFIKSKRGFADVL